MKLVTRLLLTLPFIIVTFLYLKLNLADNGCWGLIEGMYTIVLFILFAVTIPLAFWATYRKRQTSNGKLEPLTLTITTLTLCVLIGGKIFGEDFKGRTWIYAETSRQILSSQNLTFRTNGTFKVVLNEADFSCYFSGQYRKLGDTILLDNDVIDQTNSLLTIKYLLSGNLLKPLNNKNQDSLKFSEFLIVTKR